MNDISEKMSALDPFVGVWNTQGRIKATQDADEQILIATDIYEWLPGKCFLLHRVDARLGDQIMRSIEIIGWDEELGSVVSTSYDDQGATSHFKCGLDGHNWMIDGDGIRFRGAFNDSWQQLSGAWEMAAGGSWAPWMDINLTKAV